MPNINEINTAVYSLLADDETLAGLCTIYKGSKRPSYVQNPSVTINIKRLVPGEGEGIWMCDVVVTVYTDVFANRMPDHEKLEELSSTISGILTDAEIELDEGKALPLIKGESSGPEWNTGHNNEGMQEMTFGLVFVKFD